MPRAHSFGCRPAFAMRDFVVCLIVAIVVIVLIAVAYPSRTRTRATARQLNDAKNVREILNGLIQCSVANNNEYPLPSKIDSGNTTVTPAEWGPESKDTIGNILAFMIFNGNIKPEMCVSDLESNKNAVIKRDYSFKVMHAARSPADALWDPSFRGTPIDEPVAGKPADAPGNNSYAALVPIGERRKRWGDTFTTVEAVFASRGPQYVVGDAAPFPDSRRWRLLEGPTGTWSNTLLIHGGRTTWEGLVAFNDGRVSFETNATPDNIAYKRVGSDQHQRTPDNLFVNETDEVDGDRAAGELTRGKNAYLRPVAGFVSVDRPRLWID